jgi:hypothetical protein
MILSIAFLLYSLTKDNTNVKTEPVYHRIWSDSGEAIMSDKY